MEARGGNSSDDEAAVALIAVMGLPGSGKTTLCRLLCGDRGRGGVACAHLEFDAFVPDPDPSAAADSAAWKRDRDRVLRSLDSLLADAGLRPGDDNAAATATYFAEEPGGNQPLDQRLVAAVDDLLDGSASRRRRRVILLDDNFYYVSMRHAVFQLARFYNCGFGTIYLKASHSRLKLVNALREKPVPDGVIERMAQRLEAPCPERNAWEKYSCVLNDSDMGFLDLVGHYSDSSVNGRLHSLLRDCLANPFKPTDPAEAARQAEAAREVCSLSLLHQADLRLRAIVSDWLAARGDRSEEDRAELGRLAANSKRALTTALRDGKLKVPAQLNSYSPDMQQELDAFLQANICLPN